MYLNKDFENKKWRCLFFLSAGQLVMDFLFKSECNLCAQSYLEPKESQQQNFILKMFIHLFYTCDWFDNISRGNWIKILLKLKIN